VNEPVAQLGQKNIACQRDWIAILALYICFWVADLLLPHVGFGLFGIPRTQLVVAFFVGTANGQVALLAMWMSLTRRPWLQRVMACTTMLHVSCVCFTLGLESASGYYFRPERYLVYGSFFGQWTVLSLVLSGVGKLTGWVIGNHRVALIRQPMSLSIFFALLTDQCLRLMVPVINTEFKPTDWDVLAVGVMLGVLVVSLGNSLILIPACYLMGFPVRRQPLFPRILFLTVTGPALTSLLAILVGVGEDWIIIGAYTLGLLATICLAIGFLQVCGIDFRREFRDDPLEQSQSSNLL
jgi:hypothetical protein